MYHAIIEKYLCRVLAESTPAAPLWKNVGNASPAVTFTDGSMLSALYRLYKRTGDRKYLKFIDNYLSYYVGADGAISGYEQENLNVADIDAGKVLFDIYRETGDIKYKKAIDLLYEQVLKQPRTPSGSFAESKLRPAKVCLKKASLVFYTRYETEFNRGRNYEDIVNQYKNVYAHLYDGDKKLFYRGWDEAEGAEEVKKYACIRGIGWFLAGLVDTVSCFNMSTPDLKAELITLFRRTVEGLERYIDGDKQMFRLHPDGIGEEGNYAETSGSALIAYAMMKGARLGYVDRRFFAVGENIFGGICREYLKETDGNFELGGICPGCGAAAAVNDGTGIVPFIMAYSEVKSTNF